MFHPSPQPEQTLQKYSSAVSLSDMEIFVFPELLFSLVLANILSPRIWQWREQDWMRKVANKTPYRRIQRMKQFIMDSYDFNLDLDTWGLTTQEQELDRFKEFIDPKILSESNALFGYEGDKYYFDLDIRRHFGLDQYTDSIIPYWKTETIEAMDAFRFKEGYRNGAGECVSLSTLYAAALYVVGGADLSDVYLLATPLHSQNYVNMQGGFVTNNRRIVTKNMWFNGSEITWKAQRALRNEKVTIVANNTGYIHTMYDEATIDPASYEKGMQSLQGYLTTKIDMEILANFLRQHSELQSCFQVRHDYHGGHRYLPLEKAYAYENSSSYRMSDHTREKLLEDIDTYEYYCQPIQGKIVLNNFEDFFKAHPNLDLNKKADLSLMMDAFSCTNAKARNVGQLLVDFCHIQPRLPENRRFVPSQPINLEPGWSREQVFEYLQDLRKEHPVADLAFYAYRDMRYCDWQPFLTAGLERNPVVVDALKQEKEQAAVQQIAALANESIYDGPGRLAQPDEVWNFQRGDGVERAFAIVDLLKARKPERKVTLDIQKDRVRVAWDQQDIELPSSKELEYAVEL